MSTTETKGRARLVRDVAILTGSYVAGNEITIDEQNAIALLVQYTKGDETSLDIKVEVSIDGGATWFQESAEAVSSGSIATSLAIREYTATGNYSTVITPIKVAPLDTNDNFYGKIRVSFKATGGTPTGTVGAYAVTGTV